jgi:PAS domain S-box-containing protein
MKILAIDDNRDNLTALKAVVLDRLPGARFLSALDGPQGLEVAQAENPDVILLDVVMPGMDGYTVCRKLKEDERLQNIPVLFLTALRTDRESRVKALEAGAEGFLAKPFDEVELTAQIRAMVKIKEAGVMQRTEKERLAAMVEERTQELQQANQRLRQSQAGTLQLLEDLKKEMATRQQAEKALDFERNLLRTLIDNLPDFIYVKDTEHRYLLSNMANTCLLGLDSPEQTLGKTDFEFFPRELAVQYLVTEQAVIQSGQPLVDVEEPLFDPAGNPRWQSTTQAPLRDAQGKVIGIVGIGHEITEHKRTLEALRQSEERFRRAVLDSPFPIMIHAEDGAVLQISQSWSDVTGYLPEEIATIQDWTELAYGERKTLAQADIDALYSLAHRKYEGDYKIRTRSGEMRVWEFGSAPLGRLPDGRRLVMSMAMDATEHRRAEEALRESEQKYRMLFREMLDGFALHEIILDAQGNPADYRFLAINPAFERMTGLKAPEVVGRTVLEVLPGIESRWIETYGKVAITGEPTFLVSYSADLQKHFEVTAFQPAPSQFACIFADVTERKRAEEQIRKLSSAVEQSPVSVLITNPQGVIEYVNPKFTKMTGYTLEEVNGQNPRFLKGDKTSAEEYRQLWGTIIQGREWRGEFHNRKKNGEFYWESCSISPIVDAAGQITHFLAVKEDTTERKHLEEHLRRTQKLDSIGQLAGGVAHDFNNILAAIMMNLGLVEQRPNLEMEIQEAIKEMQLEAARAASLTRQLLMFSRRSLLEVKILDLNEVVANLLKMLGRLIGEHITLRFDRADQLPAVEADPGMIEQVLMNLAINARDAMPCGGRLTIRLEAIQVGENRAKTYPNSRPGSFVCLTVADTGCGMDEATQKHIFEPFFTTKETGKGTGLGLATAYGIAAQHKGWLEVESELGQGATFRVFLPVTSKGDSGPLRVAESAVVRGHETILLVEDEASVRRSVARGLRLLAYQVMEACNGQEAMALWREHQGRIDLLLSDVVMPEGLTGLELAKLMKQAKPALKVILSSGYNVEMAGQATAGPEGFMRLPKPYKIEVLSKAVRDCLDGK